MPIVAGIYYQHGFDLVGIVVDTSTKELDLAKTLYRPLSSAPPTEEPQTQQLKSDLRLWIESRVNENTSLKIAAPFLDSERPRRLPREDPYDTEELTKHLQEIYLPYIENKKASRANYADITPGKTAFNAMKVAYLEDSTEYMKALLAAFKQISPTVTYEKLPGRIITGHVGFAIGMGLIQGLLGADKPITLNNLKRALEKSTSTKPRDILRWQAVEAALRAGHPQYFDNYILRASSI